MFAVLHLLCQTPTERSFFTRIDAFYQLKVLVPNLNGPAIQMQPKLPGLALSRDK